MITKKNVHGYSVFIKDGDLFYENIFLDFLSNKIKVLKVFRTIEDTKVVLIDTARGPMVLKVFVPKTKKLERFLKSFFKKDYYENLIYQTDRVWNEGVRSVNDQYLLAEAKILNYAHVFIMLIEYIKGTELERLDTISAGVKEQIRASIDELHQHDMVSGDPHKGNFIVTEQGIRLIDLSGKKSSALRKAKDRLDLEKHYAIKNEIKDFAYYRFLYKRKLRRFMKRTKHKLGLRRKAD